MLSISLMLAILVSTGPVILAIAYVLCRRLRGRSGEIISEVNLERGSAHFEDRRVFRDERQWLRTYSQACLCLPK